MRTSFTLSFVLAAFVACSGDDHGGDGAGAGGTSGGDQQGGGGSGAGDSGSAEDDGGGAGGSGAGVSGGDDGTEVSDGGAAASSGDGQDASFADMLAQELCGDCACNDGIDNDGDGQIDGFDTECTGAADDDESTFATGISGDNRDPKWQDCFFDGDSGGGNDGCRYATECLTGELSEDDPDCEVTQRCIDYCQPRTPNGCDCFGCCTFTLADGSERSVMLEASCDSSSLGGCTECIPSDSGCSNECGRCELCPGRTVEDLPDDCGSQPPAGGAGGTGGVGGAGGAGGAGGSSGGDAPPPGYTCDDGLTVCLDSSDCSSYRYCSFGCCVLGVD